MKNPGRFSRLKRLSEESGQALPLMALLSILFLGFAGLTLDVGNAYFSYRDLQATTDAAALAGALAMVQSGATTATVTAAVNSYSSLPTAKNANLNLGSVVVTPIMKCVGTSAYVVVTCNASPTGNNVIRVTQTATVPTLFLRALKSFGVNVANGVNLGTTATASLVGTNIQANVAIIIDTTASMASNDTDPLCKNTRIYCAQQGVQQLLKSLSPCASTSPAGTCTPFDQVALFTYPNVQANTTTNSTTCPSSNPTILDYSTPTAPKSGDTSYTRTQRKVADLPAYWLSFQLQQYHVEARLNASSALAIATGGSGVKNCNGMSAPGGKGTYFAGAINAAEASLLNAKSLNPGSQNYMVILSDGDADSSNITGATKNGTTYGSSQDQCQQAILAAQSAHDLHTTVYTVAYGAQNSGCASDTSGAMAGVTPCTTMKYMSGDSTGNASGEWPANTSYFYSDTTASSRSGPVPVTQQRKPEPDLREYWGNRSPRRASSRIPFPGPNEITMMRGSPETVINYRAPLFSASPPDDLLGKTGNDVVCGWLSGCFDSTDNLQNVCLRASSPPPLAIHEEYRRIDGVE